MYWGLSPALDFYAELEGLEPQTTESTDEMNFLIIGGFDCRHVLQTIAKRYTHAVRKINFFILEVVEELYARQLLLLTIALQSSQSIGLLEKTRLWMEIYGNTLIRPRAFDFLRSKAQLLIKFITDPSFKSLIPTIDLSLLQYKEMDTLENVFLFYLKNKTYNPARCWDDKLRKSLAGRYDTREGVFDWDYHMRLKDIEGYQVINQQEYKYWRKTGIAFTWLETENSEPNLTLASGIYKIGRDVHHSGFMGSVVNGPFVAFGLSCEDKDMLKKSNDRYLKRSTDIMEINITRMFHEIEKEEPYLHIDGCGDLNLGVVISELKNIEIEKLPRERDETEKERSSENEFKAVQIQGVSVNFLPCKTFRHLPEKYKKSFDLIWIGQNLIDHVVTSNILESSAPRGVLMIETTQFLVHFSKEDHSNFTAKIEKLATENEYASVTDKSLPKNGVAVYRKTAV